MIRNQLRNGKYEQVYSQRQTRHKNGMRPMNDSLLELFRRGRKGKKTLAGSRRTR
jgi:Tfp pilus assembly pilus retraction ATPase PilT